MIINVDFAMGNLVKINQILHDEERRPIIKTVKKKHLIRDKKAYESQYNYSFFEFPVNTIRSSKEIFFHSDFLYAYEFFHGMENESIYSQKEVLEEAESKLESELQYLIYEYIEEKVYNLTYQFNQCIVKTQENYYFDCIDNNELVMKNLIILYDKILKIPDIQINVFPNLILTKEISDLLVRIFRDCLKSKLVMLNPDMSINSTNIQKITGFSKGWKLDWKGNQQDLAELMIELQIKGWINQFDKIGFQKSSEIICDTFDISHTKKNEASKEVISFAQLLKGTINPDNKADREYFFDKKNHKRKFGGIVKYK